MKRMFDIILVAVSLLFLWPVFLAVGLCVLVFLGRPLFFTQLRPGLHGQPFNYVKFRSMSDARHSSGDLLPDDQRLGRFGTLLRQSSLDELPSLILVLTGRMSLVGPRPLLLAYLPLYDETQARRHQVKPGVTGWAQIHGRNAISWEEKFKLDVWYVDHRSLWLDLKILFMTVPAILMSRDIASEGHVTMPVFTGTTETTTDE